MDELAQEEGFNDWTHLLIYEEGCTSNITSYVHKATQLYVQQFIDCADEIIGPTIDVLPNTYKKELNNWYDLVKINKIK